MSTKHVFLFLIMIAFPVFTTAGELIDTQLPDNWTTFYSFASPNGASNFEAADDIEVIGTIDRITVDGYLSNQLPIFGITIRFYQFGADGKPGTLLGSYVLQAGDPNFSFDPQGNWLDVTLSPPFSATGKHFFSVQPVTDGSWNWWNANHTNPKGQLVYTRTNSGTWSHPMDVLGGQPFQSDLAFFLYGTVTGPPRIDALSATTLNRSGYLEVFGANFGGSGKVTIGGLQAAVTTWTNGRIVAYVPETASLATVPVQVITAGGFSNVVSVTVTSRAVNGRLKWRFRMDGPYAKVRPVIGPDGTIYSIDVFGHLYALTPDGGLKWVVSGAGDKGVAVDLNGTVYAGSEDAIKAFYPDGTMKWNFVQNPRAFILVGISVGPDGNIYGVATHGIGVFSLTPSGTLRWTRPEVYQRQIVDYGEIVFGPNVSSQQLYFSANNHTRALRLDGTSVFTISATGQPAIGPDGNVHIGGGTYSPNGALLWGFTTPIPAPVDVGSDGIIYGLENAFSLFAINPNGSQRWHTALADYVVYPIVDPFNTQVALDGSTTGNQAGYLESVSTTNGSLIWRHTFPIENGFNQFLDTRARFTPDGRTIYVVTATATGDNNTSRSFVNAIDAGSTNPPSPPPTSTKLRSTSISLSGKVTKGVVTVNGSVTVKDESNSAAAGVKATIRWTLPNGTAQTQTAVTNNNGIASFKTSGGRGTYTLAITNLEKAGYTFDSTHSVLMKSITK